MLKVTLVKSPIANTPRNRAIVKALGLGKTGRSVYHVDTPSIRGMIHRVKHLLAVEEVEDRPKTPKARGKRATARLAVRTQAPPSQAGSPTAEPGSRPKRRPAGKKSEGNEEATS